MERTKEYVRDAAADWPCGCKLALKKLCDCDNPAELDYVQCPMHQAAPALLEALEEAVQHLPQENPAMHQFWQGWLPKASAAIEAAK